MKVIILIDGQNLYYGLKNLKVNEWDITWDKFFQSLLTPDNELVRTYWFRPQKLMDTYFSITNIKQAVCFKKFRNYFHLYLNNPAALPANIIQLIEQQTRSVQEWLNEVREKFAKSEYKYDQISLEFGDIEIVKTGVVKIDPFKGIMLGEKGVDIALAVKMMTLSIQKRCDKIILISGDYDYAEAIRFVKDNMTKVHLVKIHKGYPPQNKSVSRDLAVLADRVIDVYESDLKNNFIRHPKTVSLQ